ncbi:MAG: Telomerase protein component 1 [Bogoriella megaspora]|nr:MAG: Telomerase protein component 1 [Bogoriella megaspora]
MASLLRQIVAGPRARHAEAGLDLCYVTDNIIATSGPSGTYPQRAYRNPLDTLVKFLDSKHGPDWAIWEFRAEGTGYPDSEVYNRIWHYPWPDHHPPPFKLIPMIMASMRNWLKGMDKEGIVEEGKEGKRVVVVHCKAGKGRSGTSACSYLIAEEGWKIEDALKRFTERRMRPGFGTGVSIPSQLRWIGYVDRWARHEKVYVERQVEITELHVWGVRDGVKISVEGYVDDGKTIKTFHVFQKNERQIVRGFIKTDTGLSDVVSELMARRSEAKKTKRAKTLSEEGFSKQESTSSTNASGKNLPGDEDAGADVIFKPLKRVALPSNDINIDFERRNKAAAGWTMVTSVAHVWFNAFFNGQGPEQNGRADESGVFEIEWDECDGIKGSARKGTKCFDKISVVWRTVDEPDRRTSVVIEEPKEGEAVPQMSPADWHGEENNSPEENKDLGLRIASPSSASVSRASSVKHTVLKIPEEEASELTGVRSDVNEGNDTEEALRAKGPLPLSRDLPPPGATASETALPAAVESSAAKEMDPGSPTQTVQSPASIDGPVEGIVKGTKHISTEDLPDGKPEGDLKTSSEHTLGHLKKKKDTSTSS